MDDAFILVSLVIAALSTAAMVAFIVFAGSDRIVGMGRLFYRTTVDRADTELKDMFVTANPVMFFWGNLGALVIVSGVVE